MYYEMDTGEDDGSAPAAERPAPLLEVLPQAGLRRHTGEAFELVLDPVVPQLGRDLTVLPDPRVSRFRRCFEAMDEVERVHGPEAARRFQDALRQGALEREAGEHEQEEGEARSSNKMGKKGKRRRRRKKKLPKGSSSSLLHDLRRGAANEYVEVAGYSGGVETAPYMEVMSKFFEEKVVWTEEFIHKHGQPVKNMYGDPLHLYTQSSEICWLDWMKDRWRYVRRMGCLQKWTGMLLTSSHSHDWCEERVEQTLSEGSHGTPSDKTVKDVTWLLFDDSLDLGLQLGRINAVFGYIH